MVKLFHKERGQPIGYATGAHREYGMAREIMTICSLNDTSKEFAAGGPTKTFIEEECESILDDLKLTLRGRRITNV